MTIPMIATYPKGIGDDEVAVEVHLGSGHRRDQDLDQIVGSSLSYSILSCSTSSN